MTYSFDQECFAPGKAGRRSERVRASEKVRLLRDGCPDADATLVDISHEGFLIEVDAPLAVGSLIWIDIPSLRLVSGKVVWQRGGRAGCQFTHRLKWRCLHRFQLADEMRGRRVSGLRRIFR